MNNIEVPVWLQILLSIFLSIGFFAWMLRIERVISAIKTKIGQIFDRDNDVSIVARLKRHSDSVNRLAEDVQSGKIEINESLHGVKEELVKQGVKLEHIERVINRANGVTNKK